MAEGQKGHSRKGGEPDSAQRGSWASTKAPGGEVATLSHALTTAPGAQAETLVDDEFDLDIRLRKLSSFGPSGPAGRVAPGVRPYKMADASNRYTCHGYTCDTRPHTVCDAPCNTEGMITCETCHTHCNTCDPTCPATCETCVSCETCVTCATQCATYCDTCPQTNCWTCDCPS